MPGAGLNTASTSIDEEVPDVVAEMTNMIIGNINNDVESATAPLAIGVQAVVHGRNFRFGNGPALKGVALAFTAESEVLKVRVLLAPVNERSPVQSRTPILGFVHLQGAQVEKFQDARHYFYEMAESSAPGTQGPNKSTACLTDGETIVAGPPQDMNLLVRAIAGRVLARLPKSCGIEMADLIQAGNIGLLQASRTFSPESGAPLAGYAKFRIRGEMLDTVRRTTGSRRALLVRPSETTGDQIDLENRIPAPPEQSPHRLVANSQRAVILGEEIERLPPRYRTVVRLRYSDEYSLREIGAVLRVRESRACQLHRSALSCLKRALLRRGFRDLSNLM